MRRFKSNDGTKDDIERSAAKDAVKEDIVFCTLISKKTQRLYSTHREETQTNKQMSRLISAASFLSVG